MKCLVGAWWLCLFVLEITLYSLLFALLLHYILLPSPLGEGLGVRPFSPCCNLTYYSPLPSERGWGEALYKTGATQIGRPILLVTLPNFVGAKPLGVYGPLFGKHIPFICLLLLQSFVTIASRAAQLFLDTDKLVVLSHTVGAAQRTSLNLA